MNLSALECAQHSRRHIADEAGHSSGKSSEESSGNAGDRIVLLMREMPVITVREIARRLHLTTRAVERRIYQKATGAARATAKRDLEELVRVGLLKPDGARLMSSGRNGSEMAQSAQRPANLRMARKRLNRLGPR